ncbi:hypothetical protein [Spongiibacter nanhainus]|nr:hypothetical protein [Spongiibacter nanhainus]
MVRMTAIAAAIVSVMLVACEDEASSQAEGVGLSSIEQQGERATSTPPAASSLSNDKAESELSSTPPSLDLSYSEDDIDVRDLSEEEVSRYQMEGWFESQNGGDKKLSVKPKIRLKEDATLEQTMGNYRDSLDGAEMGIEYKTP